VAQGVPPRRSARLPEGSRRGQADEQRKRGRPERPSSRPPTAPSPYTDAFDDHGDEDLPPWAGLGIYPTGPGGKERRPRRADQDDGRADPGPAGRSGPPDADEASPAEEPAGSRRSRRAAAARARKSRRRLIVAGVVIVAGAVAVLAILGKLPFQGTSAPPQNSGLVTTFQRGEFRSVPNTCDAVSTATLSQYLPGKVAEVSQALGTSAQSQCTWTLDSRPNFRVLTVTSQAYAPSLLASGDGSATFSAIDAYGQELQTLQNPPKSTRAPKAQIGGAVGLGREAFTAFQVFHVGGATTDEVTAVARDRNVLIIVTMQGQEHGGGFGPVPAATLRAAALAAAHEALAGLH
jgi:hypothetical protein